MADAGRRERVEAAIFYGVAGLSIVAWWDLLLAFPTSREPFFGAAMGGRDTLSYSVPDLLMAFGMVAAGVPMALAHHKLLPLLAWLIFGASGYAFLKTLTLAALDSTAYWGVPPMMLLSGISALFAVRFSASSVLWGAFRFRRSSTREIKYNTVQSLLQTAIMWGTFLGVVPTAIYAIERLARWNLHWLRFDGHCAIGASLFILFGLIGIASMLAMIRHGKGSPLPSACAHELVVAGPYRYIRNPMAVSGIAQGVSLGIGIGSPIVIAYAFLGGVAWEVLVRHEEESYLYSEFGEEYSAYRDRVRCWIPTFRHSSP